MKRVLITGGNRGIGKAIVESFMQDGQYQVVFTYRSRKTEADQLLASFQGRGAIHAVSMDLLQKDSIISGMETAIGFFGGFDIVIHNAGIAIDNNFYLMEEEEWTSVIQTSLNSFYYINKAVVGDMIANRWGRIICLASVSGEAGNRGQVNYSAAKGAIIAASKALSKEVARKGITVNVVSPGLIETEMTQDLQHFDIKQLVPVGRMGKPSEVAAAVKFLSTPDASYINGTTLQVNGGMYT